MSVSQYCFPSRGVSLHFMFPWLFFYILGSHLEWPACVIFLSFWKKKSKKCLESRPLFWLKHVQVQIIHLLAKSLAFSVVSSHGPGNHITWQSEGGPSVRLKVAIGSITLPDSSPSSLPLLVHLCYLQKPAPFLFCKVFPSMSPAHSGLLPPQNLDCS